MRQPPDMAEKTPTFLQYYQRAESGDAEAQFQVGCYFAKGVQVAQSYHNAGFYWLKAAKQSHLAAQIHLGILFEKGLGFAKDGYKAKHCYQTAASLGSVVAKVRLAILYLNGQGVAQDFKKAIALFIQAAEQGEAVAQYNLGIAYEKGWGGLTQNDDLAHFWYEQAAKQHHSHAQQKLQDAKFSHKPSHVTAEGTTLPKPAQTAALASFSFSDDDLPSSPDSDHVFAQGVANLHISLNKAFHFFEKAARLGHAKAQYNMGLAWLYGLAGNQASIDTAVEWLEKSASQSYRPAYLVLGWLYQGGDPYVYQMNDEAVESIVVDYDNAISQFEMASELGHAQAQYFLAQIYATGNGTAIDLQKAQIWRQQAAKNGYALAQWQLASAADLANDTFYPD